MADLFFVGTSSGKTSTTRNHSSILISTTNYNLLIDAGDGIPKAFLLYNIDFNSIDGVLITHLHPDHYTGLASLIVQMKMYNREKSLDLYINAELKNTVKNFLTDSYLYPDRLGFGIEYRSFSENISIDVSEEISFIARKNSHLASVSELNDNSEQSFSCSSFLLNIGSRKIFYTSDVGSEKDLSLFDDNKYDFLISEITHVDPKEIINKSENDNFIRQIIFTHYSDEDVVETKKFINNLNKDLKSWVILAVDGLKVEL